MTWLKWILQKCYNSNVATLTMGTKRLWEASHVSLEQKIMANQPTPPNVNKIKGLLTIGFP